MRFHSLAGVSLFVAVLLLSPRTDGAAAQGSDPSPFLPADELRAGATFTPDERTVYFTRYSAFEVDARKTIMVATLSGSTWSAPVPASFSGPWSDTTPSVSPDGMRLYFASNRPLNGVRKEDFDLWYVDKTVTGWSEARHLENVNSSDNETSPALTAKGVLYFCSWREQGGLGLGDLWRAEPMGKGFGAPRNLGAPINGATGEWGVAVSADETVLIFESSGRSEGLSGAGDLYYSRASGSGWTTPVHLGAPLNSPSSELAPRLSPDGRTLFFASNRGGKLGMWRAPLPTAGIK